jgi:hypothetical protein
LSFKPKTDDMREAPAIPLIESLLSAGVTVQAHDPEAMKVARGLFGSKITYATNNYDALKGADCLAIVTEWNEFRRPDFERMRSLMRSPVIFDGRNLFTPDQMKTKPIHLLLHWPQLICPPSSSPAVPGISAATPPRRSGAPVHRVVIYDNFSAGHRGAALGAPVIEGDIGDVAAVRRAIRESGAAAVMHFAAWLSVPGLGARPERVLPQ